MTSHNKRFIETIQESIAVKNAIINDGLMLEILNNIILKITQAYQNGNKVMFAGNGGSAADAQHLAAEFVSRLNFNRPGLPALSLSTDTSVITAISNDYGYENLFSRQIQSQGKAGDIFIGISTSGKSVNILNAFTVCKELEITSLALCGLGGDIDKLADHILRVPSYDTARIQEAHIMLGHIICAEVENIIFSDFAKNK